MEIRKYGKREMLSSYFQDMFASERVSCVWERGRERQS